MKKLLRQKKKNCYIGVTRPTLKLSPTLHFFIIFLRKNFKNLTDRPKKLSKTWLFFFGDIKYGGAHRKKQKFNQHESSESCDCSIQHGHLYAILDVGGGEMWAKNTVSNYKTGRIAGIGRKFCPRVIQEFQKMVNMLLFASKLVKMIVTAVVHTWISHSWKQYRPCKTSPTEAYCFFEETDVTTDVEPVDAFMANATTVTRILPPKKETSTDTTHNWKHQIESFKKKIPTHIFSLACYANITIYLFFGLKDGCSWAFRFFYVIFYFTLWYIPILE